MNRHVARKYVRRHKKANTDDEMASTRGRKGITKASKQAPKPGWDSTVSDLSSMKLSQAERERRQRARKSKHRMSASAGVSTAEHDLSDSDDEQPNGFDSDNGIDYAAVAMALRAGAPASKKGATAPSPPRQRLSGDSVTTSNDGARSSVPSPSPAPAARSRSTSRLEAEGLQLDDDVRASLASADRLLRAGEKSETRLEGPCGSTQQQHEDQMLSSMIARGEGLVQREGSAVKQQTWSTRVTSAAQVSTVATSSGARSAQQDASLAARVAALESQMVGLATLKSLVSELKTSVDSIHESQADLRSELARHCSHTSSLVTQIQAQMQTLLDPSQPSRASPTSRKNARINSEALGSSPTLPTLSSHQGKTSPAALRAINADTAEAQAILDQLLGDAEHRKAQDQPQPAASNVGPLRPVDFNSRPAPDKAVEGGEEKGAVSHARTVNGVQGHASAAKAATKRAGSHWSSLISEEQHSVHDSRHLLAELDLAPDVELPVHRSAAGTASEAASCDLAPASKERWAGASYAYTAAPRKAGASGSKGNTDDDAQVLEWSQHLVHAEESSAATSEARALLAAVADDTAVEDAHDLVAKLEHETAVEADRSARDAREDEAALTRAQQLVTTLGKKNVENARGIPPNDSDDETSALERAQRALAALDEEIESVAVVPRSQRAALPEPTPRNGPQHDSNGVQQASNAPTSGEFGYSKRINWTPPSNILQARSWLEPSLSILARSSDATSPQSQPAMHGTSSAKDPDSTGFDAIRSLRDNRRLGGRAFADDVRSPGSSSAGVMGWRASASHSHLADLQHGGEQDAGPGGPPNITMPEVWGDLPRFAAFKRAQAHR